MIISPNSSGFTPPTGEAFDSFAENSSGELFVKTDAGNFYALDKADVANDGTFTLDATSTTAIAIQSASDGTVITGELREIQNEDGSKTEHFFL